MYIEGNNERGRPKKMRLDVVEDNTKKIGVPKRRGCGRLNKVEVKEQSDRHQTVGREGEEEEEPYRQVVISQMR